MHFKIESDSKTVANALQPCLLFLEMATSYFAPIHSQAEKPHVLLCRVSKIGPLVTFRNTTPAFV